MKGLKDLKNLDDKVANIVLGILVVLFFGVFMMLNEVTGNLLYLIISPLVTIKLSRGFSVYCKRLDELNKAHCWRDFISALFFRFW